MSDITRALVSVQQVEEIKPINGADLICAYRVKGWWVVDQVNRYEVGDLVLYAEIDSWMPTTIAPFLSKGKEPRLYNDVPGERLRTVKLKGQVSQGLLLPIDVLYTVDVPDGMLHEMSESIIEVGTDYTKLLNVQKWEAPINAQLAGQAKGNFPHFIQKTDQERIQNIQYDITTAFENKDEFEVTVKLDGSSITVYRNDDYIGVCSRNLDLKLDQEGNTFIDTAKSTGLYDALEKYGRNIAVQGELMGPGVQGNRENFTQHTIFIFDIFDINEQQYLSPTHRNAVVIDLYNLGYSGKVVPPEHYNFVLPTNNIDELLVLAEGKSINHKIREGLVFKRIDGQFSFKIINNEFLVKEK
jgi:RNA ligase (TIGR02306 family)